MVETKNYSLEDNFRIFATSIEARDKNDFVVATVSGDLFLLEKLKNAAYDPDFKRETQSTIIVHPFSLAFVARTGSFIIDPKLKSFNACLP